MTAKEIIRRLKAEGWREVRSAGSHRRIGLSPEAERGVAKAVAEVARSLKDLGHEVAARE